MPASTKAVAFLGFHSGFKVAHILQPPKGVQGWREIGSRESTCCIMHSAYRLVASANAVHLSCLVPTDPLTRPAPAGENAGCGPSSPPKGRGKWIQITSPLAPLGERGRGHRR
jgi:hypothetical protein